MFSFAHMYNVVAMKKMLRSSLDHPSRAYCLVHNPLPHSQWQGLNDAYRIPTIDEHRRTRLHGRIR